MLWIAAAIMAVRTLVVISMVDKPREPITGDLAVGNTIVNAFFIAILVYAALHV